MSPTPSDAPAPEFARFALWGDGPYFKKSKDLTTIMDFPELTYRYIEGEIATAAQFKALMDNLVLKLLAKTDEQKLKGTRKRNVCMRAVNKRRDGKASLEMFFSVESVLLLSKETNPEAAYRKSLERTFEGIFALYQSVGVWIDVVDVMNEKYGYPDLSANIAAYLALFPLDMYTKHMGINGELLYTPTVRGPLSHRNIGTKLVGSLIFDYITLLWPNTPVVPGMDRETLTDKIADMQTREQFHSMLSMHDAVFNDDGSMTCICSAAGELRFAAGCVDVEERFCEVGSIFQRRDPISAEAIESIAAADALALPGINYWMNRARTAVPSRTFNGKLITNE
jgi:hypothetical protein